MDGGCFAVVVEISPFLRSESPKRGGKPTLLISLREDPAAAPVAEWVREQVQSRVLATR